MHVTAKADTYRYWNKYKVKLVGESFLERMSRGYTDNLART